MDGFYIDKRELDKIEKAFKKAPKLLRPVTANVLNSLAFDARKRYVSNIDRLMIVRSPKFIHSAIRVQKAKSGPIERQVALSGSINKPRFTGLREQEKGLPSKTKRAVTTAGRRGSKRNRAIGKARLKQANKFYKPEQFAGKTQYRKFLFMMRVIASRGKGEIIISNDLRIRKGILHRGLYQYKGKKLTRLQAFDVTGSERTPWMSKSNDQLIFSTDIIKKYRDSLKYIISRKK
jgi:hypothetical protein